ncbi:DUF262 domain-containing protein [Pseudoalteromonas shioyasakiensis]|nr:DUF262 domain-containing protein [Pseudoalteromonas shioyasakiensis]
MTSLIDNLSDLQSKAKERTVKTQTIEYDLDTIVKKIANNVIKLNPEYQRKHRWSGETSSRLIESLILNIPVPFIYISQDIDVDDEVDDDVARYSVIDGQQRLTAIFKFFKNEIELNSLEVLPQLNGCKYRDLPPFLVRRLEERSIRCLRIDSTLDQQVKYDIFERLNSGSVKLEPQELRNATCRGPFKTLIKQLIKNKHFVLNTKLTDKRKEKMEDEELVLRFFAFGHDNGYLSYQGGLKTFLTSQMIKFNKLDENVIDSLKHEFEVVMKKIHDELDDLPFAKYRSNDGVSFKKMSDFNVSVYDAVVGLSIKASIQNEVLNREALNNLFSNKDFFAAIEGSTNDASKVHKRINMAKELI